MSYPTHHTFFICILLVWFEAQDYVTHYVFSVAFTGLSLSAASRKIWMNVSCTYWSVTYPFWLYQLFVEWYVSAVWYIARRTLRVCGIPCRHWLASINLVLKVSCWGVFCLVMCCKPLSSCWIRWFRVTTYVIVTKPVRQISWCQQKWRKVLASACWLDVDVLLSVAFTQSGKFECELCSKPEERRSHLLCDKSLKSHMENLNVFKTCKGGRARICHNSWHYFTNIVYGHSDCRKVKSVLKMKVHHRTNKEQNRWLRRSHSGCCPGTNYQRKKNCSQFWKKIF